MDLQPRGYHRVMQLMQKGVTVPNPLSLDIGDDVDIARIAGEGVVLYPGCRIYGAKTVISAGVRLGAEAPVTIEDCRMGPKVELKGGYFKRSVFLEKAGMGSGAQVREGCLLEEEANGAHCVGLKQTILFPFVTLGSLINFCDCLMAGGVSRKDHSEVGSSYVHFNYTPDGDKSTPSLFGDVPRGVMLDRPPIFLGGQGGAVGPVRVGYGTVVAAGSVLLDDVLEDGMLVAAVPPPGFRRERRPHAYRNLARIVRNNLVFLAGLVALEEWYAKVRAPFFSAQELGGLVYEGALDVLALAKGERSERLVAMAAKVPVGERGGKECRERMADVCALFLGTPDTTRLPAAAAAGEAFLEGFEVETADCGTAYTEAIRGLTPGLRAIGVEWLQHIVDGLCHQADALLPALDLFPHGRQSR